MPPKVKRAKTRRETRTAGEVDLVPPSLSRCAFFITFALPNLVFSGGFFFSTLHLMKWAVTLAPAALLGAVAGYRVLRHGARVAKFRLDGFAAVWLLLLIYTTLQPLWASIRSPETFYREWFFFASLWLIYVLASLLADKRIIRAALWGALLNAALNVLFAEIQIRGLGASFPFIAPVERNYIGNTGQQNMFAFWMAISGLGGVFLVMSGPSVRERPVLSGTGLALLAAVFWGLVASTSRSGILSLWTGLGVMSLFYLRLEGRRRALPKVCSAALLFAAVLALNLSLNTGRASTLVYKVEDMVSKPLSIANRDSIWATSWTMFTQRPWRGVGLGQFKWNYLDANNTMLRRWPGGQWQFTHWAHNEFLQWMAEGGVAGAALMFFLWGWWGVSAWRAFYKKKPISPEAVWGSSLVACFLFNALWTRPFHRIENAVWLALAFAVSNREMLIPLPRLPSSERFEKAGRLLGAIICVVSIAGLVFMADGIRGDRLLRLAREREGGDAGAVMELYRRAYNSPMVRDLAEKEIAYFSIELGKAAGRPEMIADGLNTLLRFFERQPNTTELTVLLEWAKVSNNPDFRRYVESFVYRPPTDAPASEEPVSGD